MNTQAQQATIMTLAASQPMVTPMAQPKVPTKVEFNVIIDSGLMEGLNDVAQGIVAELTIEGRNSLNIRSMLDANDYGPIEEGAEQLADKFGASSDPIKRLRARLDDYGKLKGNKRLTVKRQNIDGDMAWKVVEKADKVKTPQQVTKSLEKAFATIIDLTDGLDAGQKLDLIDTLKKGMHI